MDGYPCVYFGFRIEFNDILVIDEEYGSGGDMTRENIDGTLVQLLIYFLLDDLLAIPGIEVDFLVGFILSGVDRVSEFPAPNDSGDVDGFKNAIVIYLLLDEALSLLY